ncbi:hypothetical protein HPP92_006666 [Vanilla planifolia]|uniref:Uncharacterized protein n=1 Tax=Vanilla planifolia TaxID=51239 RepID=A0A835V8N8_VANPL|nr:hypothetical protein HPP92_006666 [Vanilla planifolia]
MFRLLRLKIAPHFQYSTATVAVVPPSQPPALVVDPTLTLYFLQKSCKLSPTAAAAAAKKINLKSTKNAHAVLELLRQYGFSDAHISSLVCRRPQILLSSPTRIIKPKFDLYTSVGISDSDLADIFSTRAHIFLYSTQRRLAPNLGRLRTLFSSDADLRAAVLRYPSLILSDLQNSIPTMTNVLKEFGLPMASILKLLAVHPRCLADCPHRLKSKLDDVKNMGISPSCSMFVHIFAVISKVPKLAMESRMQNFVSMGWTKDEVISAFIRHPYCLSSSEEKIKRRLEFFADKFGWGPATLMVSPVLLSLSLEKRILPRYSVLKLLQEKNLLKIAMTTRQFLLGDKRFKELYVKKYHRVVPEILDEFIHEKL